MAERAPFMDFDRFCLHDRTARRCGSTITVPNDNLLESLKTKILSIYKSGREDLSRECKYYATLWKIQADFESEEGQQWWDSIQPKAPPPPRSFGQEANPEGSPGLLGENLTQACLKLCDLQRSCMKDGYLVDIPSEEIQAHARDEYRSWSRRGVESNIKEWKTVLLLLRIPNLVEEAQPSLMLSTVECEESEDMDTRSFQEADETTAPVQRETQLHLSTFKPCSSELQEALTEFIEEFVPVQNPDISQILHAVDSIVSRKVLQVQVHGDPEHTIDNDMLSTQKQIVVVHRLEKATTGVETSTAAPVQCQMTQELERLRKENDMLKNELTALRQELQVLKAAPPQKASCESSRDLSEDMIKMCNTIPKKICEFYAQMTDGIYKFDQLPESLKKNARTKGSYSKRKAVYHFIRQHPGGPQECISKYSNLTTTQLYEQHCKKSRRDTAVQ